MADEPSALAKDLLDFICPAEKSTDMFQRRLHVNESEKHLGPNGEVKLSLDAEFTLTPSLTGDSVYFHLRDLKTQAGYSLIVRMMKKWERKLTVKLSKRFTGAKVHMILDSVHKVRGTITVKGKLN